jgi:hypothetical protein
VPEVPTSLVLMQALSEGRPVWIWLLFLLAIPLIAVVVGLVFRQVINSLLTAVLLLVFVWLLAVTALTFGWLDADGFIDCRRCTDVHDATAVVLFYTPVIVGILLLTMFVSTIALKVRRTWLRRS